MSGALSVIKEIANLYAPTNPHWANSLWWTSCRIAFVVAAFLALYLKHKELTAEKEKNAKPDVKITIQRAHVSLWQGRNSEKERVPFFQFQVTAYFGLMNERPPVTTVKEFRLIVITDNNEGIEAQITSDFQMLSPNVQLGAVLEKGRGQFGQHRFVTNFIAKHQIPHLKEVVLTVADFYDHKYTSLPLDISVSSEQQVAQYWEQQSIQEASERDAIEERRFNDRIIKEIRENQGNNILDTQAGCPVYEN